LAIGALVRDAHGTVQVLAFRALDFSLYALAVFLLEIGAAAAIATPDGY